MLSGSHSAFEDEFPKGVELSSSTLEFFRRSRELYVSLAPDEVTLQDLPSDVHPNSVNLSSWITRNIQLKSCGILSAAMDTVTEKKLALELAKLGGVGVIHRNMDAQTQTRMVQWVRQKINYGGMVDNPITFSPRQHISDLQSAVMKHQYYFTSFPIVDENNVLLGLITRDEFDFLESDNPTLGEIMKPLSGIVLAREDTDTDSAYEIMRQRKVKKLPVVNSKGELVGMYVWNDVKRDQEKRELFSLDKDGHFLVGAAIGFSEEEMSRAELLVEEGGCKLLVLDSSHGACAPCRDQIRRLRERFGNSIDIIAGNIASYESAMFLLQGDHKPDALKVGIGPGSICTTRSVTGHGVPQLTAIHEVFRAVQDSGYPVPVLADGGIRNSGDIVKLLAAGCSGVMLGSMFAGTSESPGTVIVKNKKKFKRIRGMGSRSAMEERHGSRIRYQGEVSSSSFGTETITEKQKEKVVPEGVEGLIEFKGPLYRVMNQILGGVKAGLAHSGADTIKRFQRNAKLWKQSAAGLAEGNPHNIDHMVC